MNPHFKALRAAYQLHYYLCFKTHYLRPMLHSNRVRQLVNDIVADVCSREQYHLLESDMTDDHLRLLLSLEPTQTVSRAVQMLKGNVNQKFTELFPRELEHNCTSVLWARGYFARSSGRVDIDVVRNYLASQVSHHGYRGNWTEALEYQNPNFKSPAFSMAHCVCKLDYHLVLVTQNRLPIFDEAIAPGLFDYITLIGKKHQFVIDRISLLPDHLHLIFEARPTVSVESCARAILENTHYWMGKNYCGVLKQTNGWDLWQHSFYAGTVGEYTTAQVKQFLGRELGRN